MRKDPARQVGEEIEITPEMIEAATFAYDEWYREGGEADGAIEDLAVSLFRAMNAAGAMKR